MTIERHCPTGFHSCEEVQKLLLQLEREKKAYDSLARSYNDLVKTYDTAVLQIGEDRKTLEKILKVSPATYPNFALKDVRKIAEAALSEKRADECTMNCLKRWPHMGHHPDCPTRKCLKHGLTVCDECAGKRCGAQRPIGPSKCLLPVGHDGYHRDKDSEWSD